MGNAGRPPVDEALLRRLAALPHGGQRWLKTALHAIAGMEPEEERAQRRRPAAPPAAAPPPRPSLEDVLAGDVDLEEQARAYPELAEELQGLAEIADLLREVGRSRRRLGEDILRDMEEEDEEGREDPER